MIMHSLDEVALIPKEISSINHRSEINPFYDNNMLPIFTAPMTCIVNEINAYNFFENGITPIIPVTPRTLDELTTIVNYSRFFDNWVSVSLDEFEYYFVLKKSVEKNPQFPYKILIDCADGHLGRIYELVKTAKNKFKDKLIVMIGNIANPLAYNDCCMANVDYVRLGVGGGSACTTSVLTGHHVSLEYSLKTIRGIKEIGKSQDGKYISFDDWIKTNGYTKTKIIADGGINSIDKAIKALALGADYVMLGKMLAQCYESCGDKTWKRFIGFKKGKPYLYRKTNYYGQSSERGQIDRFGYVKSSPEGKEYLIPVNNTISSFVDKFEAALRSSMSYAGAKTLDEFIGKVDYKYQTESEFRAYNK